MPEPDACANRNEHQRRDQKGRVHLSREQHSSEGRAASLAETIRGSLWRPSEPTIHR
jgi:hypothetical protein